MRETWPPPAPGAPVRVAAAPGTTTVDRLRGRYARLRVWAATPQGRVWVDAAWVWALTRSAGVLLAVPYAVEFALAFRTRAARWWQAGYVALIAFAAALYSAYLWLLGRPPLPYATAEGYWGRSLRWTWTTFVLGIQALTRLHGKGGTRAAHFALNFATLLAFVALTIAAFRVLPRAYGFYALALMLYLMIFPATDPMAAVQGDARLMLMIFPIFMAIGVWGRRTWLHEALIVLLPPLLTIAATHYLLHLAAS